MQKASKTEIIVLQSSVEVHFSKTKIHGINDKESNEMKDLGLIFVIKKTNWTENAKTGSAKALKALYSVKKNPKLTNMNTKLNEYEKSLPRL